MDERLAASPPEDLPSLLELQSEIERFGRSLDHAVVLEDEAELFDLTAADWRLELQYGKLIFEAWDSERSIVRRLEAVSERGQAGCGSWRASRAGTRPPGLSFGSGSGSSEVISLERPSIAGGFAESL